MHDMTKRADDSSGGVKVEREHCSFATNCSSMSHELMLPLYKIKTNQTEWELHERLNLMLVE